VSLDSSRRDEVEALDMPIIAERSVMIPLAVVGARTMAGVEDGDRPAVDAGEVIRSNAQVYSWMVLLDSSSRRDGADVAESPD
jgi:hypothetical protein